MCLLSYRTQFSCRIAHHTTIDDSNYQSFLLPSLLIATSSTGRSMSETSESHVLQALDSYRRCNGNLSSNVLVQVSYRQD